MEVHNKVVFIIFMAMDNKIDFIITWVDEHDPAWRKDFECYSKKEGRVITDYTERYRDWDTLRYWFRGVEKFAPWVNKIFFVTYGHLPKWLDTDNPKLVVVKHEDFIPKEYLPTFNSNVIEFFFHKIKDLSDKFVYFNDDMFIINKIPPHRFFKNGLPCDMGSLYVLPPSADLFPETVFVAVGLINEHFKKKEVMKKHFFKWYNIKYIKESLVNLFFFSADKFPHFKLNHLPLSFLKSTYHDVWSHCEADLLCTCKSRFRDYGNVAFWVFRYWQLATGRFSPYNYRKDGKYYSLKDENIPVITDCIRRQKKNLICLNDYKTSHFEDNKRKILEAFESILPDASTFEKPV